MAGDNPASILFDEAGNPLATAPGAAPASVLTVQGDPAGTPVPVSGSVSTSQGTPAAPANAWPTKVVDAGGVNVASVSAAGALKVDGSAVTQPVSAASLPLPTGAATSAQQTDGTQKAITRGGAKGTTTAADVTSTNFSADRQALDVAVQGPISATLASVGVNGAPSPSSSTQVGGMDPSSVLQAAHVHDLDSGGGSEYNIGVSLRKSAPGGSVELGTPSNPVRVDPTGATTQPVSVTSSVLVDQGSPASPTDSWPFKLTSSNGLLTAVVRTSDPGAVDAGLVVRNIASGVTRVAGTAVAGAPGPGDGVLTVQGDPAGSPVPVSGAVTANIGTTGGLALDATLANQATAANQLNGSQKTRITDGVDDANVTAAGALQVDGSAVTQPISAAALPLPAGAATEATLATRAVDRTSAAAPFATRLSDGAAFYKATTPADTQPISAVALPLPAGAATEATLGGVLTTAAFQARINTLGQKASAASTPVVLSSDQPAIPVTQSGNWSQRLQDGAGNNITSQASGGQRALDVGVNVGGVQVDPRAIRALTSADVVTSAQGAAAATAGAWPTKVTDGTNVAVVKAGSTAAIAADPALVVSLSPNSPLPAGTAVIGALSANQTVNLAQVGGSAVATQAAGEQKVAAEGTAAAGAAVAGNPVMAGASDGTNAQRVASDTNGVLYTATLAEAALRGRIANAQAGPITGFVATNATTEVAVRETAYTEQSSNAQRSFTSGSANDTSAGTGARTIRLTYYSISAGVVTGPFTEDVTMNGTTAVNTSSTTICFVEKIEVLTAGSGGVNAGVITMFAAVAAGGGAVASIAVGKRRTNYAHHYVANGRTCFITDASMYSTAASSQQPVFNARSLDYSVTNAAERFVADNMAANGSVSSKQFQFPTPRKVSQNSRVLFYVTPSNGTAQNQGFEASFYEV